MSNCVSLKKTGTRIQLTLKIVKKKLKYGEHIMRKYGQEIWRSFDILNAEGKLNNLRNKFLRINIKSGTKSKGIDVTFVQSCKGENVMESYDYLYREDSSHIKDQHIRMENGIQTIKIFAELIKLKLKDWKRKDKMDESLMRQENTKEHIFT